MLRQKTIHKSSSLSLTLGGQTKVLDKRALILTKLKKLREYQRTFMPGSIRAIAKEEESRPSDATPPSPEHIKLWLPSDFPPSERATAMAQGLADAEAKLREAQCNDAFVAVRRHLHYKQHLVAWRDANAVGQSMATRSRTLIDSTSDKVRAAASKYRLARRALIALCGEENVTHLPPLLDSDLTSDIVVEDDDLAQRRLANVSKKKKRVHNSTGKTTVSWIWTKYLGPKDRELGLEECTYLFFHSNSF